jgi:hypothetical protein
MTTSSKRPTPTQLRAARRRRQSRRKRLLAIAGLTAASTVALLLILGLILPGLPFDALFGGAGNRDIFETGAAQAFDVEVTDVQVVTPEDESPGDSAAAPPLPPNPVLGGVDIFYNCPDGCDDLVAQLSGLKDEFHSDDTPVGLTSKTDMDAKILLIGADANKTLEDFDDAAIRAFIEANTNQ